jgi:hypothetical protein
MDRSIDSIYSDLNLSQNLWRFPAHDRRSVPLQKLGPHSAGEPATSRVILAMLPRSWRLRHNTGDAPDAQWASEGANK